MTDFDKFLSPMGRHLHESAIRRMGTVTARDAEMCATLGQRDR